MNTQNILKVKVAQSCPTLCDPLDYTVYGILQARMEWVAIPFHRGSSQPRGGTQTPELQVDSLPAKPPGKEHSGDLVRMKVLTQKVCSEA